MAIYNVQANGNAQSGLKTGDYVKTAGGMYQILDGNSYQGMSSDQLKGIGVNYNPVNGYYSKKVDTVTSTPTPLTSSSSTSSTSNKNLIDTYTGLAKYQTTDTLDKWKDAYVKQQVAALQNAYNTNSANLAKTYNDNYANSYNQIASVKNDYSDNIQKLYDDTYKNNALALQQASSRGLTSSAQGIAMGTSGLMDASKQASSLTSDRDTLISNIQTELNRLTSDYNIDKDTLAQNFSADKINALSTGELQWLQGALDIEANNNNTYNSFLADALQNQFSADEADKDRNWQSNESALDRNWQSNESALDRDWQSNESLLDRNWQSGEADKDRNWQSNESALDRNWQSSESALDRNWQSSESDKDRNWQSGENALDRALDSSLKDSDAKSKLSDGMYAYLGELVDGGNVSDYDLEQLYNWMLANPNATVTQAKNWFAHYRGAGSTLANFGASQVQALTGNTPSSSSTSPLVGLGISNANSIARNANTTSFLSSLLNPAIAGKNNPLK